MLGGLPTALVRRAIAWRYLRGHGIEIGALHNPLPVPPWARVTYVDRAPVEELRQAHREIVRPFHTVDLVDDGERLGTIADGSLDFVIANHFLEHCQDPIGAIGSFARVLRPGGVVYLAVPDKRRTFDARRPVTSLAHLVADHRSGPAASRRVHYEEWARLVEDVSDDEAASARAAELEAQAVSIHFHVFTHASVGELLAELPALLHEEVRVVRSIRLPSEGIFVLERALSATMARP